jgi:hypothetical protein
MARMMELLVNAPPRIARTSAPARASINTVTKSLKPRGAGGAMANIDMVTTSHKQLDNRIDGDGNPPAEHVLDV